MSKPRVTRTPEAQTGNVVRDSALGLVPETVEAYLRLQKTVWSAGPLNPAELEMLRLRNARKVGCVFCKAVRYDVATEAGLDEDKIGLIDDDFADSDLSQREKLLLSFADHYFDNSGALSPKTQDALREEFGADGIAHISIALLLFNTFSRCAVALGGMPEDDLPLMKLSVPE